MAGPALEAYARPSHEPVPVFYVSDGTGRTAEAMGEALLREFPDVAFERTVVPFVTTLDDARRVVQRLDAAAAGPATPLVFLTVADDAVRLELHGSRCPLTDVYELHLQRVEAALGTRAPRPGPRRVLGDDVRRDRERVRAIDYAVAMDDAVATSSASDLGRADVVVLGPSGCGKTALSMLLAVQHGLFVANGPLPADDVGPDELPSALHGLTARCIGLSATPSRLAAVRHERRPGSAYASLDRCAQEVARAEAVYEVHDLRVLDSSNRSVDDLAALVRQAYESRRRPR